MKAPFIKILVTADTVLKDGTKSRDVFTVFERYDEDQLNSVIKEKSGNKALTPQQLLEHAVVNTIKLQIANEKSQYWESYSLSFQVFWEEHEVPDLSIV